MPCAQTDPVLGVIDTVSAALLDAFTGEQCPPRVGQAPAVRFFAGDSAPLTAWDSHASQGCTPFVWVRLMRHYLSTTFPTPSISTSPCGAINVVAIELGVGWCAVIDEQPAWDQYQAEFLDSTDVRWRMGMAMCRAAAQLGKDVEGRQVGTDTLAPYGPEGGVIAWTGVMYVSY